MKGMYGFLSRGVACMAVALVILSVLAMPTQGVRANDPSPDNNTSPCSPCSANSQPCSQWGCYGDLVECGWMDCYDYFDGCGC